MNSESSIDLEKLVLTESDFDGLDWHDCKIHAIFFNENYELVLDIDYIVKWVEAGKRYKFWISPSTLVFENVYNFELENSSMDLIIDLIEKVEVGAPGNKEYIGRDLEYEWTIQLISGWLSFRSVGFKQYLRQWPVLYNTGHLEVKERGGVTFDRVVAR